MLEAETERARIDLKLLQDELAQLSQHVGGYTQARVYLHAVCNTQLLPQAARVNLTVRHWSFDKELSDAIIAVSTIPALAGPGRTDFRGVSVYRVAGMNSPCVQLVAVWHNHPLKRKRKQVVTNFCGCLQEPPAEQPTATEFKSLIQSYCMALGPDTVTLPKGLPFRKERLDVIKDINAELNSVLKNTKL